jgi:chaperonin GroES
MPNHGKGGASLAAMEATGVIPDIAALARKNAANKSGGVGAALQGLADAPLITPEEIGNLQLRGDMVLVQPKQAPNKSDGGVLLPDAAQPRPSEGVVIAAGPGQHTQSGFQVPTGLKYGDRVRFLEESWNPRIIRGKMLLLMRDVDILGVFPDA